MNQGQKVFYDFIMERVREDKKEEAKALLEQSFPLLRRGNGLLLVLNSVRAQRGVDRQGANPVFKR